MQESYAQEGEDLILNKHFWGQVKGFYVDIGAHHPMRFSNTYLLYKKGWRGINIDATPGSMSEFNKVRPRDINIESAVGVKEGRVSCNIYNESALNSLQERKFSIKTGYKRIKQLDIDQKPLHVILDKRLPKDTTIDLYTIDVEGLEMDVLESNNWNIHSPSTIIVEDHIEGLFSLEAVYNTEISKYLSSKGYYPFARTNRNTFFNKS